MKISRIFSSVIQPLISSSQNKIIHVKDILFTTLKRSLSIFSDLNIFSINDEKRIVILLLIIIIAVISLYKIKKIFFSECQKPKAKVKIEQLRQKNIEKRKIQLHILSQFGLDTNKLQTLIEEKTKFEKSIKILNEDLDYASYFEEDKSEKTEKIKNIMREEEKVTDQINQIKKSAIEANKQKENEINNAIENIEIATDTIINCDISIQNFDRKSIISR